MGWNHDADGRLLADNDQNYTYDASGQMVTAQADSVTTQSFDGEGQRVKTVKTEGASSTTTYYVRSSVLGGQVLTELSSNGAKQRTFVYSGNQVLAWQESPFGSPRVMWEHRDPSNASFRMSDINASLSTGTDQEQAAELDPLGADSGTSNNYLIDPNPPDETTSLLPYPSFSDPRHPGTTYAVDGVRVPVDFFSQRVDSVFPGSSGLIEAFARESKNDDNYMKRRKGSGFDYKDEVTNIPIGPSISWLIGWQPLPQDPERLTPEQVDKLGSNLQKFLDDPECGKFIKALLTSLPDNAWITTKSSGSLMDVFNGIKNGGGFWSGDTGGNKAKTDPMTMTTRFDSQRSTPYITGRSWEQLGTTVTLVHELTHIFTKDPRSGVYGHLQMARAASSAADTVGLTLKSALMIEFPTTQKYGTGYEYDVALANYYDAALAYACRKVKL